jgi:hypothetical protein
VTEKLKAEIRKKYIIKTNIIGTAACKMAMQFDLHERVREEIRETHTREHMENKQDTKRRCREDQQLHFAKPLLYGGQGEQCEILSSVSHDVTTSHNHAGSQDPSPPWAMGTTTPPDTTSISHEIEPTKEGPTRLGLDQPRLAATGEEITGANKNKMHAENRKRRRALQQAQHATQWTLIVVLRWSPSLHPTSPTRIIEIQCAQLD